MDDAWIVSVFRSSLISSGYQLFIDQGNISICEGLRIHLRGYLYMLTFFNQTNHFNAIQFQNHNGKVINLNLSYAN